MKNLLILGLTSLLLFAVAAGLSVWLQQSKTPVAEEKDKDKEKKGLKDDAKEKGKDDKSKEAPKTPSKDPKGPDEPYQPTNTAKADSAAQARLEKQKLQQALILEDIRVQREEIDQLYKAVSAAQKVAAAAQPDPTVPDPTPTKPVAPATGFAGVRPATPPAPDPNERKSLERIAITYESMPPETAAKLLQDQADGGKMDIAVKVLVTMRERAAGKVIAEMPDRSLASQLMSKMLEYKKPTPPLGPGS